MDADEDEYIAELEQREAAAGEIQRHYRGHATRLAESKKVSRMAEMDKARQMRRDAANATGAPCFFSHLLCCCCCASFN